MRAAVPGYFCKATLAFSTAMTLALALGRVKSLMLAKTLAAAVVEKHFWRTAPRGSKRNWGTTICLVEPLIFVYFLEVFVFFNAPSDLRPGR